MGFFDWLKKIFGGKGAVERRASGAPPSPAVPPATSTDIRAGRPPAESITPSAPKLPRRVGVLNLDAGDFLPIGREELVKGARQNQAWGNPWFGRRDVIPPADDERTKLIDRGLVTQGLLTPEELVEIHVVGAQMERVRPSLIRREIEVQRAGAAAVEADRERRAALKEQKKKAAAERKRLRADLIAQRRATDIQFLGRGVSGRLGQRSVDRSKLLSLELPVLATPADVATALSLSIPQLRWLAFHTEVASRIHYIHFTVPKKSGGTRLLSAPHKKLAAAQQWILENILNRLPAEPPAHGFLPGRSIVTNAQAHVGRRVVLNMDLESFFPSITFPRVRSVFHRLGYSQAAATVLALLCTECPRKRVTYDGKGYWVATGPRGLPQGACTSPALSNQVARRLDKRLGGLARKLEVSYTRYADDLTFSGNEALQTRVGYVMARVRHIAADEGFAVNDKKSRVLRRHAAQRVTGLVVNERPTLARKEIRRLRAILHRASREGLDNQNREGHPHFHAWLQGSWPGRSQ
jgi:retron-type reverse transcriptase